VSVREHHHGASGGGRVKAIKHREPIPANSLNPPVAGGGRLSPVATTLSIGQFARVTHLSVKALRHYHDVGLLEPAEVHASSGYRYYTTGQVPTAHMIKRFRDLEMPIDRVKAILAASDQDDQHRLISTHLKEMEQQLRATQAAVASLRALLEEPAPTFSVEYRTLGSYSSCAVEATIERDDLAEWWEYAFAEIAAALQASDTEPAGPRGGLYEQRLFEEERGRATVYVPVQGQPPSRGKVRPFLVPGAEVAVTVHHGPHESIDRAYGALGVNVSEHDIGLDAPVRERYLVGPHDTSDQSLWETEIAWPIAATSPG
jgi:DNA-binding transcriptional MerR regulator